MRIREIVDCLEIVRNKGNCHTTIDKARRALSYLQGEIKDQDWNDIAIALAHMELGEGANELNDKLKKLKTKLINHDKR